MNQSSHVFPALQKRDQRFDKQMSRAEQPIREKIMFEPKRHDLNYDIKHNYTTRKTVVKVPIFNKIKPRSTLIPGVT